MNSVAKVIKTFKDELKDIYPSSELNKIIEIVFKHELNFSKTDLLINTEYQLSENQFEELNTKLKRLKNNEPVQYVLGETVFYGLKLKVTPGVLIPRQETEELVDWILKSNSKKEELKILDIGTGSGCIALSVAANFPNAKVFAYDISEKALKIAKSNAKQNNLEVIFEKKDILKCFNGVESHQFDVLVSNPPYVLEKEKNLMEKNVLEYEPGLALFVKNDDPLQFYKAIVNFSKKNIKIGGKLYFEINEAFGKETELLMKNNGFDDIKLKKDLNGKDRMIAGTFEG